MAIFHRYSRKSQKQSSSGLSSPRTSSSSILRRYLPHSISHNVCHGVQFENYHEEGHEAQFTRNIVRPAFQKVTDHFGMKPLIVPVVPLNSELDPAWSWYPFAMEADVQRNMIRHDTKR